MPLDITLVLIAVFAAGFGLSVWQSGKPPNLARGPRLIPWTMIAILCAATEIFLLAHVVNLMGFETGGGRGF